MAEGLVLCSARNVIANRPSDALPSSLVLRGRAYSQQSAEIFHSQAQLSIVIHIEAMNDEGVAVLRELGSSRGQDSRCRLHAEVLVQGNVGESTGGSFDDVAVGQQC